MQSLAALFLCVLAAADARRITSVSHHREGSPVERVVNLLKDLKSRITADGESEQQAYDKFACFCDKAMKSKADAIDAAGKQMRASGQEILALRGLVATRKSEIGEIAQALAENAKLQAVKNVIREKNYAKYVAETTETKMALAALEQAIIVIKEATSPALLQSEHTQKMSRAATAHVIKVLPLKAALPPNQLSLLASYASLEANQTYAPQSNTVQGILTNMYETFAKNLETATHNEANDNRATEEYISLKTTEKEELEKVTADKKAEQAEAEQKLAEETALYDTTEEQKGADVKYFDICKSTCEAKYYEWGNRTELRTQELEGIEEALEMLTSDSARELFGKAIKPGKEVGMNPAYNIGVFLQLDSKGAASEPANKAYEALKKSARAVKSVRLAQIAADVRLAKAGHFEDVINAIDEMIQTLKDEDASDIEKRDTCKKEYLSTASTIADLEWKIKNNKAVIAKKEDEIDAREVSKEETIANIKEIQKQMEDMTKQRAAENAEFLQAKNDDQAAIHLLDETKGVLERYYKAQEIKMGKIQGGMKDLDLVQKKQPEFERSKFDAPETEFSDKGSRKDESKGIISILTMIIEDLGDEIRNDMKDEETTQLQYEAAMYAAKNLEVDLEAKKLSLEKAIARLTEEKGEETGKKENNQGELDDEVAYKEKITPDCDWIIGAFEERADKRTLEMNGLVGAKEFLVGAVPALVQGSHSDLAQVSFSKLS